MKPFSQPITDPRDVAYVRNTFVPLEDLCAGYGLSLDEVRQRIADGDLPHPTYALADGTAYVPRSYFDEACTFEEFALRFTRAARIRGLDFTSEEVEETWQEFLTGVFGVCLREPCPESIVEKAWLTKQIDRLVADARPDDRSWRTALEVLVDQLDRLEAEFTLFDRRKYGPVSRQRYVEGVRFQFALPSNV